MAIHDGARPLVTPDLIATGIALAAVLMGLFAALTWDLLPGLARAVQSAGRVLRGPDDDAAIESGAGGRELRHPGDAGGDPRPVPAAPRRWLGAGAADRPDEVVDRVHPGLALDDLDEHGRRPLGDGGGVEGQRVREDQRAGERLAGAASRDELEASGGERLCDREQTGLIGAAE